MNKGSLTPSKTQQLLAQLQHTPQKRLGQNFLIDPNIIDKILSIAEVKPTDTVVEVGPGLGTLSGALLSTGAQLHAIEIDPTLHGHLKSTLQPQFPETFHLTLGDAVKQPLASLPASAYGNFKIVANLPYAISTPWIEGVLSGPLPKTILILIQKEAADRFVAIPGGKDFGAISLFLQSAYEQLPGHKVANSCFYPVPKVASVLFKLRLRDHPYLYHPRTKEIIRALFTQRRKQIGGLCKHFTEFPILMDWAQSLTRKDLSLTARAETLPFEAWQELDQLVRATV